MTQQTAVDTARSDADAELKARLAALQQKREAIADAREQREKPTLAEQVALEERNLAEDEKFDELAREHGSKLIEMIRPADHDRPDVGAVIVRAPHLAVYRRFQESGKADFKTFDALVRPCLLYPSKAEFDALCERMSALHTLCCNAVVRLAGHRGKDVEAKQ